jgi:hypothetical protein
LIVSVGEETHLEGSASDDGLPSPPGQLSFLWTQLDGPAAAAVEDPTALHTHVEFAAPGSYTFRLMASDGVLSAQDSLVVTVTPASGGGGPPWWNAAWSSRQEADVPERGLVRRHLVNFPVLVVLDASRVDYNLLQNAGQDLRFIDADGSTLLNYEIESFNKAGSSFVWVNVPKIDAASSSDFIWLYYGNPSAPAGENKAAAWDSSFSAVWHLRESPAASAPQARDSTAFANHATSSGAMTAAQQLSGRVNGSIRFDGVDDYLQALDSPSLRLTSGGTLEAWIKANTRANFDRVIAKDRSTGSDAFVISLVPGADRLQFAYAGYRADGSTLRRVLSPSAPGTTSFALSTPLARGLHQRRPADRTHQLRRPSTSAAAPTSASLPAAPVPESSTAARSRSASLTSITLIARSDRPPTTKLKPNFLHYVRGRSERATRLPALVITRSDRRRDVHADAPGEPHDPRAGVGLAT